MNRTYVKELPDCDMCKLEGKTAKAEYDAPTKFGSWGYLCRTHFKRIGRSYGATKLIKVKKRKPKRKFHKTPTVKIPIKDSALKSVVTVNCPYCGQPRKVEPDANYTVECEACGQQYKVASYI